MMLEKILQDTESELKIRQDRLSFDKLRKVALRRQETKSLERALKERPWGVIAEVKRASPSRGPFTLEQGVDTLVRRYARSGAAAISVVTERKNFRGSLGEMRSIATILGKDGPPILCKDFIFDPYQVYEALAYGADAILLIVTVLGEKLGQFIKLSQELGLGCVVEVHSDKEVEIAVMAGSTIIGINNRNLKTFEVDLETTYHLFPLIPPDRLVISESGIRSREDIKGLKKLGVRAVLVGEALLKSSNIEGKIRELYDQN